MMEEGADTDIALSKPYKQLSHSGGQQKHLFFFFVHLKNLNQCKTFTIHFMTGKNCIMSFVAICVLSPGT